MISHGISIPWMFSTEWIRLDFQNPFDTLVKQTLDVDRSTGEVRVFNVDSHWDIEGTRAELTLSYFETNNPSFSGREYLEFWGQSLIEIDLKKPCGRATWKGEHSKKWDGSVEWTRIDQALREVKKRETVSRIKREQQRLRIALLALDKKCAITGEELPEVIDAAHIISAADGGKEVLENAILLRADLHRLLDSKQFHITAKGAIVPNPSLPSGYLKLLANKQLPTEVHLRVRNVLLQVP
ncbi:HNH endonuclease [Aeromonas salmonicida]|uniref:HNH endonuclease n=1 Tax=Aeromonas salmonicida TaxID=645 RepID=UPI0022409FD4|nr:HNH endonuclease [Aeromonas salmonicida]